MHRAAWLISGDSSGRSSALRRRVSQTWRPGDLETWQPGYRPASLSRKTARQVRIGGQGSVALAHSRDRSACRARPSASAAV